MVTVAPLNRRDSMDHVKPIHHAFGQGLGMRSLGFELQKHTKCITGPLQLCSGRAVAQQISS